MRRGLFAALAALSVAVAGAALAPTAMAEEAAGGHETMSLASPKWTFSGLFGTFDQAQLKRGFEVYHGVCSACHSLKLVAYRNLSAVGLSDNEIKAVAAEKEVAGDPDDEGNPTTRKALPSDHFVPPFANDNAARASNNGALPPDLSLIVKARAGGPDYVYSILTGYTDPPAGFKLQEGLNYNRAFAGHQIAMPKPLNDDQVTYADGTKASLDQEARDVVTFLTWAAEPELAARKRLGIKVLLFLILLTAMLYAIKRKVWSDLH
ncbi:MAG: cytochrome c1 [Candidatus Eiseniibacteriota bacterium]